MEYRMLHLLHSHFCVFDIFETSTCFLTANQKAWETFEKERDGLTGKLDKADAELEDIRKVSVRILSIILFKTRKFYAICPLLHAFLVGYTLNKKECIVLNVTHRSQIKICFIHTRSANTNTIFSLIPFHSCL